MSPTRSPTIVRCGRRTIEITHPDKALFRDPKVTKLDLARHYEAVAEAMLPHLRGRPLALEVFRQGIEQRGFFMKSVRDHFPEWVKSLEVLKKGGHVVKSVAVKPLKLGDRG